MASPPTISRIPLEDVAGIDGVERLLTPLNGFMTSTHECLSKGITFTENSNAQIKTLDVTVVSPWTIITSGQYTNTWAAHADASLGPVAYRRTDGGDVEWQGVIASGTINTAALTVAAAAARGGLIQGTSSNAAHGEVRVSTDGVLTPAVGNNSYFSLWGLRYEALDPGPGLNIASTILFKSELRTKCVGLLPLSFVLKSNPGALFALPRLAWEDGGTGQIKITNLLGVVPGNYSLTVLALAG